MTADFTGPEPCLYVLEASVLFFLQYMCSHLMFSEFVLIAIPVGLVYIFLMIYDSEHFLTLLLVLLVFLFFVWGEGGNVYSTYCPWSNWVVLALMSYMSS